MKYVSVDLIKFHMYGFYVMLIVLLIYSYLPIQMQFISHNSDGLIHYQMFSILTSVM